METYLILGVAALVGILSSARLTRLLTQDVWPPVVWLRIKWDDWTEDYGDWNKLFHCHWCMGPWTTAVIGAWGWASNLHWTWWAFNIWLAAAYLNSMIVERDEVRD